MDSGYPESSKRKEQNGTIKVSEFGVNVPIEWVKCRRVRLNEQETVAQQVGLLCNPHRLFATLPRPLLFGS